ncbi:hypothetical protein CEUSTIGMA_g8975.t1 [Chlamydomonas eustigma]|uniref:Uncharacterized protein n=1 Tax=Chlamydomonas eustigma TaxID=1157962 RepID=A0A250XEQ2_9CHLO|nr:hypothetical protein CEUSTIGMA_g8975.t1 [Chlamydomonas eustigma]|eukprot:GAX81547.1 hypothetical protein CEUSTIGMA_g8975.t1 [Chlamydomonas eustigma]
MSVNEDDNAAKLRAYVHRALSNKAKGVDSTSYLNLLKEFSSLKKMVEREPNEATVQLLANTITALKDCTSALRERTHDGILNEVLSIKLWSCSQVVRAAVLEFVANIVVSNSAFTHSCLQLLVYSFLPPPSPPAPELDQGEWIIPEDARLIQTVVLGTLEKIIQMVPTSPTKLLQLIIQSMPHKLRDRNTQCLYLCAVLGLAERPGGGPIREGLLAAAVEHLLSIDVEIRWEDIVEAPNGQEGEEEAADEAEEDIFELEGMVDLGLHGEPDELGYRKRQVSGDRGGWEGTAASVAAAAASGMQAASAATATATAAASVSGRPAVDETANKMDSLMELMLKYFMRRQDAGAGSDLWSCMLSIFERSILSTNRSKFTQYLVFYLCSCEPEPRCNHLVEMLLSGLRDDRQPEVTRSACAAYLASFLARASFVPQSLVLSALEQLVSFCRQYAEEYRTNRTSGGGSSGSETGMARPPGLLRSAHSASSMAACGLVSDGSSSLLPRPSSMAGLHNTLDATAQHQVYYASIQSALYILCYQLRGLMGTISKDSNRNIAATKHLVRSALMPLLVNDPLLAPLSMCLPSVVAEFRHQALSLGLADATALQTAVSQQVRTSHRPLEMFFPFDPYLLKRSSKVLHLKHTYVQWRRGLPSTYAGWKGACARDGPEGEAVLGGSVDDEDSDVSGDEAEDVEDSADMEEDHEEEEDVEGVSSEDSDGLEGMSLPSDSLLSRPNVRNHNSAASLRPPKHPRAMAPMLSLGHGSVMKDRQHLLSHADDMAVSYSPGSFGDVVGTSPVLVNYTSPNMGGGSPMQMTPVHYVIQQQMRAALH